MKKILQTCYVLILAMLAFSASGQSLSGIVFRDYNGNGQKNNISSFNEPYVSGITVKAFNAANMQVGPTKTTDASGAYSFTTGEIPNGTPVRIEFSGLGTNDYPSANGTQNGTNIQFVTTGAGVTANFAINANDDYWNNNTNPSPSFLVIAARRGYAVGGFQATEGTVLQANTTLTGPYNPANSATPPTGTITTVATQEQTGSLFGLALQKKQQRYFAAAILKRAVEVGPQGLGGIYVFEKSGVNFSLTGSFTLQGVTPANGGGVLDFGTVTRNKITPSNNNYLANNGNWPGESRDIDAYAKVGTVAYGDIEADPNSNKIYMVNLFQRRLIVFDASAATATLNAASTTTLAPFTTAYDITALPGMPAPTGAGNNIRPYAVKIYKGVGYLGVVSDAMATQNAGHLRGYILQFDPNNIAAGVTNVLTINFNTWPTSGSRYWNAWATTWAQAGGTATSTNTEVYPTPMIAGIEFNEDGSMDIGIKDRWGDQGAKFELNPVAGATGHTQCSINGDLLHACWIGTGWALEGTSGSCTQTGANGAGASNSYGTGYSYGNTGNEWYADRSGDGGSENSIGGMTKLMGSGKSLTTIYDPMGQGETNGSNYWSTQGIQYNNVTTGVKTQIARIIADSDGDMDKANGMGDIELLNEEEPIQIGNRIWSDANGNGIQDAGETAAGVPNGTTVTLRSPGIDGVYGNGDDQTWTTTTDANGNYYFSTLSSADNRKPATWSGVGNTLLPGFEYRVEVATPTNGQLTKTNAAGNSVDNIDNDASLNGSTAIVVFNTSNTNHNFDIGFKPLATLGDKVWRDDDNDGIQDVGEPGVAGITVTLFQNGADGQPGTADDIVIGTTVTDAYGNYLFDNLAASTNNATQYNIGYTLPANYQFTTQTNTQTTGSSNATNITNTTGGSTAANGSDANTTTGRTGSFWLAPGEVELTVDAGIKFTQPATNSIGDKVWYDADGDGVQDANEAGVSGVTVTLYASDGVTVIATTITDANGNYIFTDLPANTNYIVGITPPAGMILTSSGGTTSGNNTTNSDFNTTTYKTTAVNTGTAGNQITGIDAGLITQPAATASLGDKVWLDLNNNGLQDSGEPGVAGVTVNLYRDANGDGVINGAEAATPYATTVTDAFGNYIFNNLLADAGGTAYQVGFVLPTGYSYVTPNTGSDDFKDSDANTIAGGYTGLYFLSQGQRNMSVDAGLIQNSPAGNSSIGDFVWHDADADGIQDPTEVGVGGVTVTLYNSTGTAIATTTTDANGKYLFPNLAAGNYSVGFSNLPVGYSLTNSTGTSTGNGTTNSDANSGTGKTSQFTLPANTSLTGLDAGLIAGVNSGLASIGNKVWWDVVNNNNVQDAGEPGVPGVSVLLDYDSNSDGDFSDPGESGYKTTTTNALGEYLFTGLAAGNYQVRYTNLPTGSNTVTQNSGVNDNIDSDGSTVTGATGASVSTTGIYNLATGEENLSVDLGLINPTKGSLGNRVWFDNGAGGGTANDGIQNGTEQGVAGVMVTLTNAAGQYVDRTGAVTTTPVVTTTDANGYYAFADLTAGVSFAVKFSNLPAGFVASTLAGTGGGDDSRSDGDLTNYQTPAVTIAANTFNQNLDFGISSNRAALGNFVWMDDDGDGVQDAGEPGVTGVTVTLFRPGFGLDGIAGNADDALPVASMITDQNGQYLFSNLEAGIYEVEFSTIPGGTSFTQRNTPGDTGDNTNSDAIPVSGNPSVGRTTGITLSAGETDLTVDAGLFRPRAVIGNFVWADNNNNGLQDAGEPPASGIMVALIDGGGNTVAVAITDANGNYLFPNVAPGTYSLNFTNLPTGVSFTTSNVGDDNLDSDTSPAGVISGIVVTASTVNLSYDAGLVNLITLPVKLEFFAVKQGNNVLLSWKAAIETDVLRYTLERSANGLQFNDIYTVNADGSVLYNKTDAQPIQGINYYRLRITKLNGSIEYSNIRLIRFTETGFITLFPNPAQEKVNVMLPESWQGITVQIELLSQTGQKVSGRTITNSSQIETLDITNLPAGAYYIKLTSNAGTETKKIQKIK